MISHTGFTDDGLSTMYVYLDDLTVDALAAEVINTDSTIEKKKRIIMLLLKCQ
jgi:hypothetical protein